MRHYCQSKKDLLKEIKWWLEHLDGDEIQIKIKPDPAIEGTFMLDIYEKPKYSSDKVKSTSEDKDGV